MDAEPVIYDGNVNGAQVTTGNANDAVIILFLSEFKVDRDKDGNVCGEAKSSDYISSHRIYRGRQTFEAPIQFLIDQAIADGKTLTKIISIVTERVRTEVIKAKYPSVDLELMGEKITQYDLFQHRVKGYFTARQLPIPEFVRVDYVSSAITAAANVFSKDDVARARDIYQQIAAELLKPDKREYVYLDYSGGLRDTSFLMISIIKYLEVMDINLKKIVYSEWKPSRIHEIDYLYDMFQIISGVNEFINTGNSRQLHAAFNSSPLTHKPEAEDLLKSIQDFSDTMSICDMGSIKPAMNSVIKNVNKILKSNADDVLTAMLKTLSTDIKNRMHIGGRFSYMSLVLWCCENSLLQQAATIIEAVVPEEYLSKPYFWSLLPSNVSNTIHGWTNAEFNAKLDLKSYESKEAKEFYSLIPQLLLACCNGGQPSSVPTGIEWTYRRKIESLECFERVLNNDQSLTRGHRLLLLYIAVKAMRNHINHAMKSYTDDEKALLVYLNRVLCTDEEKSGNDSFEEVEISYKGITILLNRTIELWKELGWL